MIPIIVGDQSVGVEWCPLGCGNRWHGLPKEASHRASACPSPFGVPVPVVALIDEEANVA